MQCDTWFNYTEWKENSQFENGNSIENKYLHNFHSHFRGEREKINFEYQLIYLVWLCVVLFLRSREIFRRPFHFSVFLLSVEFTEPTTTTTTTTTKITNEQYAIASQRSQLFLPSFSFAFRLVLRDAVDAALCRAYGLAYVRLSQKQFSHFYDVTNMKLLVAVMLYHISLLT